MTVTADQTGLAKDRLKAGDKVEVIKQVDNMVLVKKGENLYWVNEKYLTNG